MAVDAVDAVLRGVKVAGKTEPEERWGDEADVGGGGGGVREGGDGDSAPPRGLDVVLFLRLLLLLLFFAIAMVVVMMIYDGHNVMSNGSSNASKRQLEKKTFHCFGGFGEEFWLCLFLEEGNAARRTAQLHRIDV
jgi:hypothetical protein